MALKHGMLYFCILRSGEGADRIHLQLSDGQDDLVKAVSSANPNTIVVVLAPAAILMPWADNVKSILMGFFPGQEGGNAVAEVSPMFSLSPSLSWAALRKHVF